MTPCHRSKLQWEISAGQFLWPDSFARGQDCWPSVCSPDCQAPLPWKTTWCSKHREEEKQKECVATVSSCPTDIVPKLLTVLHQCPEHHCSVGLTCCSSPQDTQVEQLFTYKTFRYWKLPPASHQATPSFLHHSPLCTPIAQCSQCELSSAWDFHRSWKTWWESRGFREL